MHVLVTGGAGFVGANIAVALATRYPEWRVTSLDNLRRRGSELNIARLRAAGVDFVHGDVRERTDVDAVGEVDAIVECSAEPSVLAGLSGGLDYLVRTNLLGAYTCLELARRDQAQFVFLSTSRVYPTAALKSVELVEDDTRFAPAVDQALPGVSEAGISEDFPLEGARTPYGATKLAAELLIAEYADAFSVDATVNRCGVIAGPWQLGKVDQGVFTYWLLAHWFQRPLEYIGYGGEGKQVRDLLHVDDLVDLLDDQLVRRSHWRGMTLNVGGGNDVSLSLQEATTLCRDVTGRTVDVRAHGAERRGDVPYYVSDCARLHSHSNWRPRRNARAIFEDTFGWVRAHERVLASALDFDTP
jgi:CDP-paratose 2-epimerase